MKELELDIMTSPKMDSMKVIIYCTLDLVQYFFSDKTNLDKFGFETSITF